MNPDTPSDDLFFSQTVASYTVQKTRFLRREWLAEDIATSLRKPDVRFVLLIGQPGAGKSSFIAQLAADHPDWPRYFIRRDQLTPLESIDDKSFFLRVGYQLAAKQPDLFATQAEQLEVIVKQRVGKIGAGAKVVGIKVERMLTSPFQKRLTYVQQYVRDNYGELTGLKINELVTDIRALTAEDLYAMALQSPAIALKESDPEKKITILVDALDEIRYGSTSEEKTILEWLTNAPKLPDNVRFILTSRTPDRDLKAFIDKQSERLELMEINPEDKRVKQDVSDYAQLLVKNEMVSAILESKPERLGDFIQQAERKADGNLGYLDALGRGIDQLSRPESRADLETLLTLEDLPDGLSGLYAFFLHQIRDKLAEKNEGVLIRTEGGSLVIPAWEGLYRPILKVLAVAQEPLRVDQIKALGQIEANLDFVQRSLDGLGQFLQKEANNFRLYHATLPEFLTDPSTASDPETQDLYVDPQEWHAIIISHFRSTATSWDQIDWRRVDGYGLRNLSKHLFSLSGQEQYRGKLYSLLCRSFMREKQRRSGSHLAFSRDVGLALAAARACEPADLVQMSRAALLYATLGQIGANIYTEFFGLMACLGQVERALGYINLLTSNWNKGWGYLSVAQNLPPKDERRIGLATSAVQIAIDAVPYDLTAIDAGTTDNIAINEQIIRDALTILLEIQAYPQAMRLLNRIQREDYLNKAFDMIGHALVRAPEADFEQEFADQGWVRIEQMAVEQSAARRAWWPVMVRSGEAPESFPSDDQNEEWWLEIALALIQRGDYQEALAVEKHLEDPQDKIFLQCELVPALVASEATEFASSAARSALANAQSMPEGLEKMKCMHSVSLALANAGEQEEAITVVKQAPDAAGSKKNNWEYFKALSESTIPLIQFGHPDLIRSGFQNITMALENKKRLSEIDASLACNVAEAFSQVGELSSALQLGEIILINYQFLLSIEERRVEGILNVLSRVAILFAENGEIPLAQEAIELSMILNEEANIDRGFASISKALAHMGEHARSLEFAGKIKQGIQRIWNLDELAEAMFEHGETEKCLRTAEVMIEYAGTCKESRNHQIGLCKGLKWLLFCNAPEQAWAALQRALEIQENDIWLEIPKTGIDLAQAGKAALADQLLGRMVLASEVSFGELDALRKGFTLGSLSEAAARAGAEDTALAIIEGIENDWCRSLAYSRIAQVFFMAGKYNQANNSVKFAQISAQASENKLGALLGLVLTATASKRVGNPEKAEELLSEQIPDQFISLHQEESQIGFLHEAIIKHEILFEFTLIMEGQEAYTQAEVLRQVVHTDPRLIASFWAMILEFLFSEDLDTAYVLARFFLENYYPSLPNLIFSALNDAGVPDVMNGWINFLNLKSGYDSKAKAWAQEVVEDKFQIKGLKLEQAILAQAAQILFLLGDDDIAINVQSQINSGALRSALFLDWIASLSARNQPDQARSVASMAINEIAKINDVGARTTAINRLTKVLLQLGETELAKQAADENNTVLMAAIDELDRHEKCQALSTIANTMGLIGLGSKAYDFYGQAMETARQIGRTEVFNVMAAGADWIEADQSIGIAQTIGEIDSWWAAPN